MIILKRISKKYNVKCSSIVIKLSPLNIYWEIPYQLNVISFSRKNLVIGFSNVLLVKTLRLCRYKLSPTLYKIYLLEYFMHL